MWVNEGEQKMIEVELRGGRQDEGGSTNMLSPRDTTPKSD